MSLSAFNSHHDSLSHHDQNDQQFFLFIIYTELIHACKLGPFAPMRLLVRESELDNDPNAPDGPHSDRPGDSSDTAAGSSDAISSSHHRLTADQILISVFVTMCLLALVAGVVICICCCHADRSIKAAQRGTKKKKHFPTATRPCAHF